MKWILQDIDFGHNLRKIRKQNKLTQSDVVTKLQLLGSKMSIDTYSKIETGVRNIRISDLIALKIIFDVDFSKFFEDLIPKDSPLSQ